MGALLLDSWVIGGSCCFEQAGREYCCQCKVFRLSAALKVTKLIVVSHRHASKKLQLQRPLKSFFSNSLYPSELPVIDI